MNDLPANIAAGASVAGATTAWLTQANQVVSLIAGLVAIVAGIYAILHYRKSLRKP